MIDISGLKKNRLATCNSRNDLIYVDSISPGSKGVFAIRSIERSTVFGYFEGYETTHPLKYSATFKGKHIEGTGILKYLNHSCDPNSELLDNRQIVAKRNISPKEEITIDYTKTESAITHHFDCNCGSANCKGFI